MTVPKVWLALALAGLPTAAAQTAATHPTGLAGCPCVEWAGLDNYVKNDKLVVTPVGSGMTYQYPSTYGQTTCKAHDYLLAPFCSVKNPPAWCAQPWCYVSTSKCAGVKYTKTQYFNEDIYWSYETCASSNAVATGTKAMELIGVMDGYLRSTRQIIESGYKAIHNNATLGTCEHMSTCACNTCSTPNSVWGSGKFDFNNVGLLMKKNEPPAERNLFTCLAQGISSPFKKIAAKEMDAGNTRQGYQYFGDAKGNYAQWPQSDWCPSNYDPRFRPWFASSVTGPKDVIIVVDVSGSMNENNRDSLARLAVKKILLTLSWKDFATVILFNHGIYKTYSDVLLPMSVDNRDKITKWADTGNWKGGGTNFVTAMDKAFDVVKQSVAAGKTSMCQKAILFLTDGQADFTEADFTRAKANSVKYNTIVFTYALGANAETTITKRLACDNQGVFYKVDDVNGDLATAMASYYEYFATGQEICLSSFVKYSAFTSGSGSSEVYTGCLPSYNRVVPDHSILGVNCMDIGVFGKTSEMKAQASWKKMVCKVSDQTKTCRQLNLDECRRQKVRANYNADSVCSSSPAPTATTKCGCIDRTCTDDTTFVDEKKYFCDQWIGDDCSKATVDWQYSAKGQADLIKKCPLSCGLCDMLNPCPYKTDKDCSEAPTGPSQCRACLGKVSGTDIDGNPMACDTGTPSWAAPAPTPGGTSGGTSGGSTATEVTSGGGDWDNGNTGVVIGIIVGLLAVGGMAIGGFMMCCRKKKTPYPQPVQPVASAVGVPAASAVVAPAINPAAAANQRNNAIVPPGSVAIAPVPAAWRNKDLATNFQTIVGTQEDPGIVDILQDMFDSTYKKVSTRDRAGGKLPERLVVQIVQRVENAALWQEYANTREAIRKKRPHKCTSVAKRGPIQTMEKPRSILDGLDDRYNECALWHGTSPAAAAAIARTGFSLKHSGSATGTMYGHGVYLAECSSKSDEYAKNDTDGLFPGYYCLMLCRTVLGEPLTMGPGGEAVHSTIDAAMNSGKFESVLGDREAAVGTYREFIVYTEKQVYPEYIVMYTRE